MPLIGIYLCLVQFYCLALANDVEHLRYGEVIVLEHLLIVVAVVESLLHSEAVNLHVAGTIEAGNLLAEAALQGTVFQGYHGVVVFLQVFQHLLVKSGDEARVDEEAFKPTIVFALQAAPDT